MEAPDSGRQLGAMALPLPAFECHRTMGYVEVLFDLSNKDSTFDAGN